MQTSDNKFRAYYKHIKWSALALGGTSAILGFVHPDSPYYFPPVKSLSALVAPISFLAICAAFLVAWFINSPRLVKNIGLTSALLIPLLIAIYAILIYKFTVTIEIPAKRTEAHVVIGYKRSNVAEVYFNGVATEEMLKKTGYDEPTLEKLFEGRSVVIWSIFGAYIALPFSLAFTFGCASRRGQLPM